MMKKRILIILIVAFNMLFLQSIIAEIKLPAIVSSNMVLQRNTTIKLWGWADAKEKITIKTSWINQEMSVEANNNGTWHIE
ncbi:MAG: sialate O-acetylesterase, partial [Dysgonamonadaceae bacterium]